jgi:murein DD-endopeptidase MepM/ murein hydrolase activator NlpD
LNVILRLYYNVLEFILQKIKIKGEKTVKKVVSSILILFIVSTISVSLYAQKSLDEIREEKEAKETEIDSMKDSKDNLEKEILEKNVEVNKLEKEVESIDEKIKELSEKIEKAEEAYEDEIKLFEKRINVMYENTDLSYMGIIIRSKSVTDFITRANILTHIAKQDKQLLQEMKMSKEEIENNKKLQSQLKDIKVKSLKETETSRDGITNDKDSLEQKIVSREKEIEMLNSMEKQILDESKNIEKYLTNKSDSKDSTVSPGSYNNSGGTMSWPVPNSRIVSSPFGYRLHPIKKAYLMHTGIDISAPGGNSIVSTMGGVVISADYRSGYGKTVMVSHGSNMVTLYAHCSQIMVSSGQSVSAGMVIAKVGRTGTATGDHLHFEVRKNGSPINPLSYVNP